MPHLTPLVLDQLLPLAFFAFVSSITPGPNNIMLASSGIRFVFLRSIPHMLGITIGFGVMLTLCAAGVGSLILKLPSIQLILKLLSSSYLLYLAWHLRSVAVQDVDAVDATPLGFSSAAMFQAVNPKAWVMVVTGAVAFLPTIEPVWLAIGLFCFVFCSINLPCIGVWAGGGAMLRRYLKQSLWCRLFSITMMGLTAYSAVAVWL